MKKIYLLIPVIVLMAFQPARAQFEKGKIMAGITSTIGLGQFGTDIMNLGLTTEKVKYSDGETDQAYKTFGFNLLPRAGYFVINNLAAGVDLLVSFKSEKSSDSDYKHSETMMSIGPYARYYFPLEKIYPFVEGNIGFGFWKQKWSYGANSEEKEGLLIYGLGIGAGKSLGEKVMIDALLGYSSQSWKDEENDKYIYGTIGLKIGISLFF